MKKRILKNSLISIIAPAAVALLILAGYFYWFQYRPTQIRKGCHNQAWIEGNLKLKRLAEDDPSYKELAEDGTMFNYRMEDYDFYYEQCLDEHGIE